MCPPELKRTPGRRPSAALARGGLGARGAGRRQRGAAIVTAMLVVVLTTVVVAGLFWRTNVTVRSVENRLALAQTHWIERAVIDWARVVLQVDGLATQSDDLTETWANPVLDTQLDETVMAGARIGDEARSAMLAGQVYDAQARFNLNNLLVDDADNSSLVALQRLLEALGQPGSLAEVIRARIQQSYPRTVGETVAPATALPLLKLADLRLIPGIGGDVIAALEPFAILLPLDVSSTNSTVTSAVPAFTRTAVNLNTAEAVVLHAVIPDLDLDAARRFTSQTRRQYRDVGQATTAMGQGIAAASGVLSVNSNFFLVRGVVRYDRVEDQTDTLLYRQAAQGKRVDIVWQQRS